ncbi:MAG: hypothetical protein RIB67_03670 [Miltoncostaeaceae bacterium]
MPTVIATHTVKDTAHWLASPKRADIFPTIGVTNIRTFVNPQHRNRVSLIMDVPDMDALTALLESDEGKAAEDYDGVLAETIEIYVEE